MLFELAVIVVIVDRFDVLAGRLDFSEVRGMVLVVPVGGPAEFVMGMIIYYRRQRTDSGICT